MNSANTLQKKPLVWFPFLSDTLPLGLLSLRTLSFLKGLDGISSLQRWTITAPERPPRRLLCVFKTEPIFCRYFYSSEYYSIYPAISTTGL